MLRNLRIKHSIGALYFLGLFSCNNRTPVENSTVDANGLYPSKVVPALNPEINFGASKIIKFYTKAHGLSHVNVRAMKEDIHGNIWFSTNKGINKYNGQTYTHYLTQLETYGLDFDSEGNLWIGTYLNGVFKYDGNTFIQYNDLAGFKGASIRIVFKDRDGNMWFGSIDHGLFVLRNGAFEHIDLKQPEGSNGVASMYQDSKGIIWIGSFGGGVFKYQNNLLTQFEVSPSYIKSESVLTRSHSNKFHAIVEDKEGELWFGSRFRGIFKLENDELLPRFSEEQWKQISPRDMFKDRQSTIWISHIGGLSSYDGIKLHTISEKDGLIGVPANGKMLYDSGDNIWIPVNGGVNKYTEGVFEYKTFSNSPNQESGVNALLKDSLNRYWVCMNQKIVLLDSLLNPISTPSFIPKEARKYTSIVMQSKDVFWLTTFGMGLLRIDTKQNKYEAFSYFGPNRRNSYFTCSFKDRQGMLWFGGLEGLVGFDGKAFKNLGPHNGLKNQEILTLAEDHQGLLWIGSETGISVYDGNAFYDPIEFRNIGVSSIIKSTTEDEMIVGTRFFGLWIFNYKSKKLIKYTEKQGMSSNSVLSLCYDHRKNLWIGTDNGIQLRQVSKSKDTTTFRSFVVADGFIAKNCSPNAVLLDNNRLLWSTDQNITICFLDRALLSQKTKPKLTLNGVKIFYKELHWNQLDQNTSNIRFTSIDQWNQVPMGLELPYDLNHITFSFIAIDWKYPDHMNYSFKLEGVDKTWSTPGEKNEIIYSALRPGKYIFKVLAINKNNNQSNIIEYTFRIVPPFWQTYWFIAFILLLLIGSIMFYVKNRERLLKERQKVLEDTVDKRTTELKSEKIIVERQNKNIKESIEYAKRIQETILPPDELVKKALPDSFIFYKPKDIVSGDFYYIKELQHEVVFSVIDCTGHGVPGALMSIIGHNLLDKIIVEQKITSPDQILSALNHQLIEYMRQEDAYNAVKDGMNLALCSINKQTMELCFSGSYNPLYIIRDQNITILKGDKIPIGKSFLHDQQVFHKETYSLKTGDVLYLFSDGFADQKGGPDKKKYFYSRFRELLLSIHNLPLEKQKQKLENEMYKWRGDLEQTDDICIIGIRM